MKAVIMAGGEGTRLRPLTSNAPKPMMPLANRPMMEHIIELLVAHDITDIVVTVAFMANTIRNHFGDGSEFGVSITYALEESPLGTAGSVRNAQDELDETFLVISGDVLTDLDLTAIIESHKQREAMATIGLVSVENPLEFGIVVCREDGSIERFLEKPTWGEVFTDTINSGIYVLEPEIFDYIAPDRPVDFSSEVFPALLADNRKLFGSVGQGYWEDVGTLEAYVRAHQDILDGTVDIRIEGFEVSKGVWVGEGADIDPNAVLQGPAIIGENCSVASGAFVGEYVVLGQGVRLGADSTLDHTVVGDNAYLGDSVNLRGTVVGRASDLRRGVRTEEGAVLGDEVFVGEDAVISDDVKVYPFKTIEARAVVNSSIIWESKGARSLFGRSGVAGLANVDVTPEKAAKLAMAFATYLKKDSTVVISRDSSRSARMLKRAIMSGLNAGGVNVLDLEVATIPVTRFVCRWAQVSAGISIRLDENDPDGVTVRFFDDAGSDLASAGQRKIERIFSREDFRRVRPADIGDIDLPAHAVERYAVSLEHTLDIEKIGERRFKVVVDYSYGSVSFVMPNVLAKLRADVLAVNPYASTAGVMQFDVERSAALVSDLVVASKAQLGAVIDPTGERITFIDEQGRVLAPTVALLVFLDLIGDRIDGKKVALPVSAPKAAGRILEAAGLEPVWTKLSADSLIVAASEPGIGFAADLDGGFIVPGFMPAFDGAAALLKMLDLLAHRSVRLDELVDSVPPVHQIRETVVTPWEAKGLVMRSLMEQAKGRETELVDGIKIHHDRGWVLLLPDPDEPITHVIAEGESNQDAEKLIAEYVRRVRQLQR